MPKKAHDNRDRDRDRGDRRDNKPGARKPAAKKAPAPRRAPAPRKPEVKADEASVVEAKPAE